MKIMISGINGFVGTNIKSYFENIGHDVVQIVRSDLSNLDKLIKVISGSDVVINLSGSNIIHRWSESYKKLLYSSRIDTTKAIVNAINNLDKKPILLSTSAVGIYSNHGTHTENEFEYGEGFLANLCLKWEEEANRADTRVSIIRLGIVLGNGGALSKMLLPFKLGLGGVIGDGKQAFSFIHIDDLVRAIEHIIMNKELNGAFNMCAPHPTTNEGLVKALGNVLKRPTFLPLPVSVLKLIYGDGSKVLTDGQNAKPKKLIDSGFKFSYEYIDTAINNIVKE